MTLEEARALIATMLAAYPNMAVNENMPKVWHECLKDVEVSTALKALKNHILKSKWPPAIAEINEELIKESLPEYLQMTAEEAINDRTHPVSQRVWQQLERMYGPWGQWQETDNKWRIKEGLEMWEAYAAREMEAVKTHKALPPSEEEAIEILSRIPGSGVTSLKGIS